MTKHPILFSPKMVQALLADRKTQTRRILKNPEYYGCPTGDCPHTYQRECNESMQNIVDECPYGKTGDLLWVRENFSTDKQVDGIKPSELSMGEPIYYPANDQWRICGGCPMECGKTRPNIFMPRWASRLTLEVTGVRVQRLQNISAEDAKAEGCKHPLDGQEMAAYIAQHADYVADERTTFARLWHSIHGADSWKENPWVWVIEFKPHFFNVDALAK